MQSPHTHASSQESCGSWVQQTNLFRKYETIRAQIDLHKYYESEKAGYDIGWDRAAIDWMIRFGRGCR